MPPVALDMLGHALESNNGLAYLDLSENDNLSSEIVPISMKLFTKGISKREGLRCLRMQNVGLSRDSLKVLCYYLTISKSHIEHLDVGSLKAGDDSASDDFLRFGSIDLISVLRPFIGDSSIKLKRLGLSNCKISSSKVGNLSALGLLCKSLKRGTPDLEVLDLRGNPLKQADAGLLVEVAKAKDKNKNGGKVTFLIGGKGCHLTSAELKSAAASANVNLEVVDSQN